MTDRLWATRIGAYSYAISPCIHCEDRTVVPRCHTNCSKYMEYKQKIYTIKAEEDKYAVCKSYHQAQADKYDKQNRTKKK